MSRITELFARTKREGRAAFVAYITAGDPHPDRTPELVAALERGGVDLIELGVPFSDPIADGPVIQRGSDRALKAGTTMARVLEIAAEIRRQSQIPLLLFTYLNPVLRYGARQLAADAKRSGVDGILLTDLSVDEAPPHREPFVEQGLDTVFLGAPTSTPERLRRVAAYSSGFIYLVSRTGVTGERSEVSASAVPLIQAMRAITDLPLALGFGISTPEQVAAAGREADGVVVGSAIVRLVEQHAADPDLAQRVEGFTRWLTGGRP